MSYVMLFILGDETFFQDSISHGLYHRRTTILEICFVAYSNPCNSLVFSSILKNKVSFGKYFKFPVECRKLHLSKSIRLEMAGDRVKPSEFETRKKSNLELSFTKVRRFVITFTSGSSQTTGATGPIFCTVIALKIIFFSSPTWDL